VRVYHCSACRKRGHNRATCPKPYDPRKIWRHGRWRDINAVPAEQPYIGLDEYIVKHLGRVPVTSRALHQRVVDDFGPVGARTFYRRLKKLRDADRASVTALRHGGYVQFLYAR
jgi:hypothetical protein